jgi:hypothetical protein
MIVRKSKVYHSKYGNGTVESVNPYSQVCSIDFKGRLKQLKMSSLQNGHVNEYKPKIDALNAIEELKQKYSRNDVAVAVLNELKGMLK